MARQDLCWNFNSGEFTPILEAVVVLEERPPLILMLRDTPLHAGHLENLLRLAA